MEIKLDDHNIYLEVKELVRKLAKRRERLRITQAEIAQYMGTSESAISRLENYSGVKGSLELPRIDTLDNYASALGLMLEIEIVKKNENHLV
jgi:transcriptional regulator with XRE-family HTH domain